MYRNTGHRLIHERVRTDPSPRHPRPRRVGIRHLPPLVERLRRPLVRPAMAQRQLRLWAQILRHRHHPRHMGSTVFVNVARVPVRRFGRGGGLQCARGLTSGLLCSNRN